MSVFYQSRIFFKPHRVIKNGYFLCDDSNNFVITREVCSSSSSHCLLSLFVAVLQLETSFFFIKLRFNSALIRNSEFQRNGYKIQRSEYSVIICIVGSSICTISIMIYC